jgi:hypothetical protein
MRQQMLVQMGTAHAWLLATPSVPCRQELLKCLDPGRCVPDPLTRGAAIAGEAALQLARMLMLLTAAAAPHGGPASPRGRALWDSAFAAANAAVATDPGLSMMSRGQLAGYLAQARCTGVAMEGGVAADVVSLLYCASAALSQPSEQAVFVGLLVQLNAYLEANTGAQGGAA